VPAWPHNAHSDVNGGLGVMARGLRALGIEAKLPGRITTKRLYSYAQQSKTRNPVKRRGNTVRTLT
jgi:hypothetical protein